jgi:transposase InsO family protein
MAMLQPDYPITRVCQVLMLPRSSAYYHACAPDEQPLQAAITAVAAQYPTYGTRRLAKQLGRAPYRMVVNRKRARRIMRTLGLMRTRRRSQRRTTNSQHRFGRFPNLVAERTAQAPDDIWVSDLTYIHLGTSFIYLAIIMDIFTRDIRGWQLGRSLAQELTITALKRALEQHTPRIHHSDQGIQYAAPQYVQLLENAGVHISMAAIGEPTQNGFAERVIRTIKEEEIALADYRDFDDALAQIGRFIDDVYRTKRIHSALGYLTPAEFESTWRFEASNHQVDSN